MYDFNQINYRTLLTSFKNAGYDFKRFSDFKSYEPSSVLSRHDIDFSINMAVEVAKIDKEEGIHSTFFVQLRSPLYNTLSQEGIDTLERIYELGHDIALHIDLSLYTDYVSGLAEELAILTRHLPYLLDNVISFHRPKNLEVLQKTTFPGIRHTYEKLFFKDLAYFSDSRGEWRFGHPISSDAFMKKKSMQLVTHPLWWIAKGKSPVEKLQYLTLNNSMETLHRLEQTVTISLSAIKLFLENRESE